MTLTQIEKKLVSAKKEYDYWCLVKETFIRVSKMDINHLDEKTAIYVCYILQGSVVEAAKAMNELGFRIGSRKYQSNDISDAIDTLTIDDEILQNVVRSLLKGGRSFINKLHN